MDLGEATLKVQVAYVILSVFADSDFSSNPVLLVRLSILGSFLFWVLRHITD